MMDFLKGLVALITILIPWGLVNTFFEMYLTEH